jgi:hypothetical protein
MGRAISIGEVQFGRFGRITHVDGGVWNAWVRACGNHTRPTRGKRRALGLSIGRNEKMVNIYRQTPRTIRLMS